MFREPIDEPEPIERPMRIVITSGVWHQAPSLRALKGYWVILHLEERRLPFSVYEIEENGMVGFEPSANNLSLIPWNTIREVEYP